jgi:hypothetical protein
VSASDIPSLPVSILKCKSNISRAVDVTSRHIIETNVNDGNVIVKRKTPSAQAHVTVPVHPEKRFDYRGKVYEHEEGEHRDHPEDLDKMNHENYETEALAKYTFNKSPERPPEPAGISAITKRKEKTKSELLNFNPIKPSKEVRNNRNGDDWLIDAAFDQVVNTGKAIAKVGKVAGKTAGKAAKAGFHATKTGIRAINEISDEIVQNPMIVRMGQAHKATLHGMATQHRHALNSIATTGNRKRSLSAGSLVRQHGLVTIQTTSYTSPATSASNPYGITARYEKGISGRVELHYYYKGQRVSQKQISRLKQEAKNAILGQPVQAKEASTTTEQSYSRDNKGLIVGKSSKSASGLVTRNNNTLGSNQTTTTNPVLNKPKTASPSGLVTINHSGLGANQSNGNTVDDSEHNPIGATKLNTPVLNITQIASPSRLVGRAHSGVV